MVKFSKDPVQRMRNRKFRLAARAQDMYASRIQDAIKIGDTEEIRALEKKEYNYWKRLAKAEGCWNCWMGGKVIEEMRDENAK